MSAPAANETRFRSRDLLGILAFLGKYPARVTFCLALLLLILSIDLSLPQFIGDAITDLRRYMDEQVPFSPELYVQIVLALVLIRTGSLTFWGRSGIAPSSGPWRIFARPSTTRCNGCLSPTTTRPAAEN